MKIGFIGAGRVGCTFGKYLSDNGIEITGYYSRNAEHAREAAEFTDTCYFEDVSVLVSKSDTVFLTVSDDAIASVFEKVAGKTDVTGKIFCHTSGSMTSKVFTDSDYEVFGFSIHPIYAVSDRFTAYKNFQDAFITIEGSEEKLDVLTSIISASGLKYKLITADDKPKYHAAAVYSSNLVCGLYAASIRLLEECQFTEEEAEKALSGLFMGNAKGIMDRGVYAQLTGPVERCDIETVQNHLNVLSPEDLEVYIPLSKEVLKVAEVKNADRDYSAMESLLRKGGAL